jgi:serine/threonine protein kinase
MNTSADVASLFGQALEIASPADRAAFLDQVCRDNPALRAELEGLLKASAKAGQFMNRPAGPTGATTVPLEVPSDPIGPYKLLQKLGEGGMGTVFLAEQEHPVKRRVALKVIKAGMDSREIIARFEQERQALAMMDHPNIAKVLDAGSTNAGLPFVVMELVKGIPITKFCDQERLTPKERLELFIPVCHAVQHAHQKGIIHRDLKPSNVLIALYDSVPIPKVIDFGVAKAIGPTLSERSLFTEVGVLVGTLEYMAPEQAQMNNLDIDTRADIYSLGVILYELLTGAPPFTSKQLRDAGFAEMLRVIKEVEPPKPSTRLSSSQELPSIAATRKLEPKSLTKLVTGELDWIVMKCLDKERGRRYETANGLALEVQRYLADEPVSAGPPSARYRLRKFTRKHRKLIATAAAFLVLLALGAAISTWQAVRATIAERATANERDKVVEQTEIATALNEFLQKDLIAQAGSKAQAERKYEQNPNLTVREALDRAAAAVGEKFADRPKLEASIRQSLGDAYREVGEPHKAVVQLERSAELRRRELGHDHLETLTTLNTLGGAYRQAGRAKDAVSVFEQARDGRIEKLGPEDPETLATFNNLALAYRASGRLNDAIALLEKARSLRVKVHGPDHPRTLTTLDNLATAYLETPNPAEAIELLEQVRDARVQKLGPVHPDTLLTLNNLALAYLVTGRVADALDMHARITDDLSKNLGPEHPITLASLNNLATAYEKAGDVPKAITLFEQVRDAQLKKPGPDHPDTLSTLYNLATMYVYQNQPDKSIPLYEQSLAGRRKKLGEQHPETLEGLVGLGVAYREVGRFAEAVPLLEQAYRGSRKDPRLRGAGRELLTTYARAGKSEQAFAQVTENVASARTALAPDSAGLAIALAEVGTALLELKAWSQAEPILRESVTILENKTPDDWRTFWSKSMLGEALLGLKNFAEAEPLLQQGYEGMNARRAKIPNASIGQANLTLAVDRLVQLYDTLGKEAEAAKWRAELEAEKSRQK